MKAIGCLRECEVVEVVGCGRWGEHAPRDLQDHVASCAVCTEVLQIALALHEDREAASLHAEVPSAGLVWWRAELRARQEAMRTASRPITVVQTFGAAAGIGVLLALVSQVWPLVKQYFAASDFTHWGVVIALAVAIFVIGPLAMYFVLSDE